MRMIVSPSFNWYRAVMRRGLQPIFSRHRVKRESVAWRFMKWHFENPHFNEKDLQIWIIQVGNKTLPWAFVEEVRQFVTKVLKGYSIQIFADRTGYSLEEIERDNQRWNNYFWDFETVI